MCSTPPVRHLPPGPNPCPQLGLKPSVRPRYQPRHAPTREEGNYDDVVATTHMEDRYVSRWPDGLAGSWVTAAEAHGRR